MTVFGPRDMYGPRRGLPIGRLLTAAIIAGGSLLAYLSRSATNPVTGEKQHISLSVDQEIALGMQSAPEMAKQFGGVDPDAGAQARVEAVGNRIAHSIPKASEVYPFDFHLLADQKTVNAFALPGGQVFITRALYDRLTTEGQLAGVLGHEIGHVVQRHSAEQMAQAQLRQGLTGAVVVGAYDPNHPASSQGVAMAAAMAAQFAGLKYSRTDESEADYYGVQYMAAAGYDPRAMVSVMKVLEQAGGSGHQSEFFATHPSPENREGKIEAEIKALYPGGVPDGLKP